MFFHHGDVFDDITVEEYYNLPDPEPETLPHLPPNIDREYINILKNCTAFEDYLDAVILDDRSALTVDIIYEFLTIFFPKISSNLPKRTLRMIGYIVESLNKQIKTLDISKITRRLIADFRALILVYNSTEAIPSALLFATLKEVQIKINSHLTELKIKKDNIEDVLSNGKILKDESNCFEKLMINKNKDKNICYCNEQKIEELEVLRKTVNELVEIIKKYFK